MDLTYLEFPVHKILMKRIYENKAALSEMATKDESQVPLKVRKVYGDLHFPPISKVKPYTIASMISTLDGKLGFQDQTKSNLISKGNFLDPEGGLADLWVLNLLRTYCDGIVFGSQTLHIEKNITGHIYDKELEEERSLTLGKTERIPWNIIFTRSGIGVSLDHRIFRHQDIPKCIVTSEWAWENLKGKINYPVLVLSSPDYNMDPHRIQEVMNKRKDEVIIITGKQGKHISTTNVLRTLRHMGIKRLLIESPSYMYHLMEQEILDEVFLNYSSIYAGGSVSMGEKHKFTPSRYPGAEILSIHIHASNFLYTRQRLHYCNEGDFTK